MPGGLMQLKAKGKAGNILTGNPTKSFFKSTYSKHTDFSMQKFRVDFDGARTLRLNEQSKMSFKIPRHADLLMDAYVSVNMPSIGLRLCLRLRIAQIYRKHWKMGSI